MTLAETRDIAYSATIIWRRPFVRARELSDMACWDRRVNALIGYCANVRGAE
jgi:hypothetical protein